MTAAQFLARIRRFVARRGKSDKIISDNAPQFKVAKNAIDLAWENTVKDPDVTSYFIERRIKWSFIIELSPWMGVFYERLISITKMALKKSIGKFCLTSIQLQTILTEIEAVVNSRSLVYVNNEVEHRTIITLMHFLSINARTGLPTLMIPEEEDDYPNFRLKEPKSVENLLETWKIGQKHLEHFWKIWKDGSCSVSGKEAKSTNTIQKYNQNRSHGLETLFKFKKTQLEDHGRLDASWND